MINKESPIFVHLKKRKRLKRHTDNNPMRKLLLSAALLAALFMSGCRPSGNKAGAEPSAVADELADTSAARVRPQYAQGFTVRYATGMRLVDIRDPQSGEGETYRFALVPRGGKPQHVPEGYTVIETPVRSVICMTTLQLSNFIKLGETEHVSGITSTRHLFNPHMRRQIEAGKIRRRIRFQRVYPQAAALRAFRRRQKRRKFRRSQHSMQALQKLRRKIQKYRTDF